MAGPGGAVLPLAGDSGYTGETAGPAAAAGVAAAGFGTNAAGCKRYISCCRQQRTACKGCQVETGDINSIQHVLVQHVGWQVHKLYAWRGTAVMHEDGFGSACSKAVLLSQQLQLQLSELTQEQSNHNKNG